MRCLPSLDFFLDTFASRTFWTAFSVATLSGTLSAGLFYTSTTQARHYLKVLLPQDVVFTVFVTFVSLVTAFRTANALTRYTDAAMYTYKLQAGWFDTASSLFAFCRVSKATASDINQFQQTLIRLTSLINALALDHLQSGREKNPTGCAHRFELLGADELDAASQQMILEAHGKVEIAFQMLQQLVVDAMDSGVLSIAPPILSRAFQEMGSAMIVYHEAQKLSRVPLPYPYVLVTLIIMIAEAVFVPFMMASYVQGYYSAFVYSFGATFLIWYMNCVDDALDNPFKRTARSLDAAQVHRDFNMHLNQLLDQAKAPLAKSCLPLGSTIGRRVRRGSFRTFRSKSSACLDEVDGRASEKSTAADTTTQSRRFRRPGGDIGESEGDSESDFGRVVDGVVSDCLDVPAGVEGQQGGPKRSQMQTQRPQMQIQPERPSPLFCPYPKYSRPQVQLPTSAWQVEQQQQQPDQAEQRAGGHACRCRSGPSRAPPCSFGCCRAGPRQGQLAQSWRGEGDEEAGAEGGLLHALRPASGAPRDAAPRVQIPSAVRPEPPQQLTVLDAEPLSRRAPPIPRVEGGALRTLAQSR